MPSDEIRKKIELIIITKEREEKQMQQRADLSPLQKFIKVRNFNTIGFTRYEDRDLDTLRKNLKNIKKTYKEDDEYYKNEITAYKVNFYVHNNSSCFLEDASIEILIPLSNNYYIAEALPKEPNISFQIAGWEHLNYPIISTRGLNYRIYEEMGTIKHKLPKPALEVSLRL